MLENTEHNQDLSDPLAPRTYLHDLLKFANNINTHLDPSDPFKTSVEALVLQIGQAIATPSNKKALIQAINRLRQAFKARMAPKLEDENDAPVEISKEEALIADLLRNTLIVSPKPHPETWALLDRMEEIALEQSAAFQDPSSLGDLASSDDLQNASDNTTFKPMELAARIIETPLENYQVERLGLFLENLRGDPSIPPEDFALIEALIRSTQDFEQDPSEDNQEKIFSALEKIFDRQDLKDLYENISDFKKNKNLQQHFRVNYQVIKKNKHLMYALSMIHQFCEKGVHKPFDTRYPDQQEKYYKINLFLEFFNSQENTFNITHFNARLQKFLDYLKPIPHSKRAQKMIRLIMDYAKADVLEEEALKKKLVASVDKILSQKHHHFFDYWAIVLFQQYRTEFHIDPLVFQKSKPENTPRDVFCPTAFDLESFLMRNPPNQMITQNFFEASLHGLNHKVYDWKKALAYISRCSDFQSCNHFIDPILQEIRRSGGQISESLIDAFNANHGNLKKELDKIDNMQNIFDNSVFLTLGLIFNLLHNKAADRISPQTIEQRNLGLFSKREKRNPNHKITFSEQFESSELCKKYKSFLTQLKALGKLKKDAGNSNEETENEALRKACKQRFNIVDNNPFDISPLSILNRLLSTPQPGPQPASPLSEVAALPSSSPSTPTSASHGLSRFGTLPSTPELSSISCPPDRAPTECAQPRKSQEESQSTVSRSASLSSISFLETCSQNSRSNSPGPSSSSKPEDPSQTNASTQDPPFLPSKL